MPPKRKTRNPGLKPVGGGNVIRPNAAKNGQNGPKQRKNNAGGSTQVVKLKKPIQRRLSNSNVRNNHATTSSSGNKEPIKSRLKNLNEQTVIVTANRDRRNPSGGKQILKKKKPVKSDVNIITDVFEKNAKGKVTAVAVASKPKPAPTPTPISKKEQKQRESPAHKRRRDKDGDEMDAEEPDALPPAKASRASLGKDRGTKDIAPAPVMKSRKTGDRHGDKPVDTDSEREDDDIDDNGNLDRATHRTEKAKEYEPSLIELQKMDLSNHFGLWRVDVQNLQPDCNKSDVKILFEFIGPVHLVKMHYNRRGVSRGMAAIYFKDWENAFKASEEYHGRIFDGKKLNVEMEPRFQRAFFNTRLAKMEEEMKTVTDTLRNAQAKLKAVRGEGNGQAGRGNQGNQSNPGGHRKTPVKFTVKK